MKRRNFLKILGGGLAALVVPVTAVKAKVVDIIKGDIEPGTAAWVAREMLKKARPIISLSNYGKVRELPTAKGNTIKFRRPVPYTMPTVPTADCDSGIPKKPFKEVNNG